MESDKLLTLLEWFKENEIKWDEDFLEIRQINGSFGVYALKDISKQKKLVTIPKTAILSTKSTGIANILDDEEIDGGCSLALAVLYEMSQGQDSPWYGYLQALPSSEDLPVFWSESEKAWFKGTEMEDAVYNDLNDLKDDYDSIVLPLLQKYPYIFENVEKHFSFDLFCRISTLISSRSFQVDAYHENALVPFADIFNHRSGNEHVHFETDFDVCEACGQLEYCEHQYLEYLENGTDDEGEGSDEEGEWSDFEEMDQDEHDGTTEEQDEDENEEEEEDKELLDLEELENAQVNFWQDDQEEEEPKDTCDMVLDKPVKAGQEIFNTYGQHPNIVLLSKYGFCHDNNQNDYVSIGEDAVFETCAKVIKDKYKSLSDEQVLDRVQERFAYFLMHEHILCPKEDEDEDGPEHDKCCGEEHDHEHEGGCCGGDENHDHDNETEEEEAPQGRSKPYFANVEGLYEDTLVCLLHTVFVDEKTFEKFADDVEEALKYFERLAADPNPNFKKTRKYSEMQDTKKLVYTACKLLSERRRCDYLDENGEWIPVEKDEETRRKVQNKREYYALTCRISEKRIIERSIDYYASRIKLCNVEKRKDPRFKKKPRK